MTVNYIICSTPANPLDSLTPSRLDKKLKAFK